jgi:hypothetical protein
LEELRKKIKTAQEIIDLDDQFPISLDNSIVNADPESAGTVGESSHHPHKHATLKGSCPTRWNSTLAMIESVCDLQKAVDNSLKKIGHAELCFNANEVELLQALKKFLKEFAKFTELVSSSVPVLSMVPLMKLKIKQLCHRNDNDDDAIRDLKNYVLMNVDRRLAENEFMKINQVLDPMTKDIFSQDDAISLLQKVIVIIKE